MATISIRVDDKLKEQTNQLADEMGISLSMLVTVWMKKFVREKRLEISIDDTHPEWYTNKNMVDFGDVPADEVLKFIASLDK